MDIIKQLNLTKAYNSLPSGSMVYAKNIMLSEDGFSITADRNFKNAILSGELSLELPIVGVINCPNEIVFLCSDGQDSKIYRGKEVDLGGDIRLNIQEVKTDWHYNGGDITGTFNYNVNNELIVAIAESNGNSDTPLKIINLDLATLDDKETNYTTAPVVPIANLKKLGSTFGYPMPLGTYYFFIQYCVNDKEDYWTSWFPIGAPLAVSQLENKELYHDNTTVNELVQNATKVTEYSRYINNTNKDSSYNFIFKLTLSDISYEKYRIGYILQHDNGVYARRWKTFDNSVSVFVFDASDPEEISISELIENPILISNVETLTNYLNRLYIGNYKESDANDVNLIDLSNKFKVSLEKDEDTPQNSVVADEIYYKVFYDKDSAYSITLNNNNIESTLSDLIGGDDATFRTLLFKSSLDNRVLLSYIDADKFYNARKYYANVNSVPFEDVNFTKETLDQLTTKINKVNLENGTFSFGSNSNIGGGFIICVEIENPDRHNTIWNDNAPESLVQQYSTVNHIFFNLRSYNVQKHIIDNDYTDFISVDSETITYKKTFNYFDVYNFYVHFIKDDGSITNGYLIYDYHDNTKVDLFNNNYPLEKIDNYINTLHAKFYADIDLIFPNGIKGVTFSYRVKEKKFNYVAKPIGLFVDNTTKRSLMLSALDVRAGIKKYYGSQIVFKATEYLSDSRFEEIDATNNIFKTDILNIKHYLGNVEGDWKEGNNFIANNYGTDDRIFVTGEFIDNTYHFFDKLDMNYPVIILLSKNYQSNDDNIKALTPICYNWYKKLSNNATTVYNITDDCLEVSDYRYPAVSLIEDNFYFNKPVLLGAGGSHKLIYSNPTTGERYLVIDTNVNTNTDTLLYTVASYITPYKLYKISDYNLNFIHLEREVENVVIGGYSYRGATTQTSVKVKYVSQINTADLFKLSAMYVEKDYKAYVSYDKHKRNTDFTNIIRRSAVISDESDRTSWRSFDPNDYKIISNISGNITNLVTLGDILLIHTEHAIYIIKGDAIINGEGNNIQLYNPNIFDVPVQPLTYNNSAYGGLQNKKNWVLNDKGYFFFDNNAKKICHFDGNGLKVLSSNIEEFLKNRVYDDVIFNTDHKNDRLLINFNTVTVSQGSFVLSYNFKANNFISAHSFKFDKNIETKNNCYFTHKNNNVLYTYNNVNVRGESTVRTADYKQLAHNILGLMLRDKASIIDIIINNEYSTVKQLDAIEYIIEKINNENVGGDVQYVDDRIIPELGNSYVDTNKNIINEMSGVCPADYIQIFTNQTYTHLIDVYVTRTNINRRDDYKKPWYDKGRWHLNYFRNGAESEHSDNRTLIYGKYFIIRFIFDNTSEFTQNFALKEINLNINIY